MHANEEDDKGGGRNKETHLLQWRPLQLPMIACLLVARLLMPRIGPSSYILYTHTSSWLEEAKQNSYRRMPQLKELGFLKLGSFSCPELVKLKLVLDQSSAISSFLAALWANKVRCGLQISFLRAFHIWSMLGSLELPNWISFPAINIFHIIRCVYRLYTVINWAQCKPKFNEQEEHVIWSVQEIWEHNFVGAQRWICWSWHRKVFIGHLSLNDMGQMSDFWWLTYLIRRPAMTFEITSWCSWSFENKHHDPSFKLNCYFDIAASTVQGYGNQISANQFIQINGYKDL